VLSYLLLITHFMAVYMMMFPYILPCVLQDCHYFTVAFIFLYMLLQSLDFSIALPVIVLRCYVSVTLLLSTVVYFLKYGSEGSSPFVCLSVLTFGIL